MGLGSCCGDGEDRPHHSPKLRPRGQGLPVPSAPVLLPPGLRVRDSVCCCPRASPDTHNPLRHLTSLEGLVWRQKSCPCLFLENPEGGMVVGAGTESHETITPKGGGGRGSWLRDIRGDVDLQVGQASRRVFRAQCKKTLGRWDIPRWNGLPRQLGSPLTLEYGTTLGYRPHPPPPPPPAYWLNE